MRIIFFIADFLLIAIVVGGLYLAYIEGKQSKKSDGGEKK